MAPVATFKDLGREAVRCVGMATAPLRDLPDFVVIGAKRCGTTSLYRVLEQHSGMMSLFPTSTHLPMKDNLKGVHYFDRDATKSGRWYRSHFATSVAKDLRSRRIDGPVTTGEASPYYMFHPTGVLQAARHIPDAKLIVMLRQPVDRAYSHYKEQVRNGRESLTFAEALQAEGSRLDGEAEHVRADPAYYSYNHENCSYMSQSMYGSVLEPWLEAFDRDRFHFIRSEDFYADPTEVLRGVESFLGIDAHTYTDLRVRNAAPGSDLDPEFRRELWDQVAADVTTLEALSGRSFDWEP